MVAEEGCCDRDPMRRGDFQSHEGRQGGVHRGCGNVQLFGAAAGPFGRQPASSSPEYQERTSSPWAFRQVTTDVGGGDFAVRKVLSGIIAGSVSIWGGDLSVVGGNEKIV